MKVRPSKTRGFLTLGAAGFALGVLCLAQATVNAADAVVGGAKKSLTRTAAFDKDGKLRPVVPSAAVPSAAQHDAFIRRILPRLGSTKAQLTLARHMGVPKLMGKALPGRPARNTSRPMGRTSGIDHNVTGDYYGWYGSQNEPSVAASPLDPDIVVAFAHNDFNVTGVPNACSVYISYDGGTNFYYDSDVPLVQTSPFCSDPVVRFSPDGFALYLSYMDIAASGATDTVRVQVRDGLSPYYVYTTQTVFTGSGGYFVDKNWIDVHTWDVGSGQGYSGGGAPVLHATTTYFEPDGDCSIIYNRSTDYGFSWTGGAFGFYFVVSDCSSNNPLQIRLVQGSRPAGGPGPQVLSCWYDSGIDGWSPGVISGTAVNNKFNIECVGSQDYGASFYGYFYPSLNVPYESAYWMGPNYGYFRLSAAGFPSLTIDWLRNAHVAFGADPNSNPRDSEAGNIYYQRSIYNASTNPFMLKWTGRTAAGTGVGAQFFPSVVTQFAWESFFKPYVWLAYYDTKRSIPLGTVNHNVIYDVTTRFSNTGGASFQAAKIITDASSLSDYAFIGDYLDGSANRRNYHVVWTDRADAISIYAYEDDVFHDRFAPPGSN